MKIEDYQETKRIGRKAVFILNYLPGVFMLIFGMVALYSSLLMMREQAILLDFFTEKSHQIFQLEEKFYAFERALRNFDIDPSPQNLRQIDRHFQDYIELHQSQAASANMGSAPVNVAYQKSQREIEAQTLKLSSFILDLQEQSEQNADQILHDRGFDHFYEIADPLHYAIEELWTVLYGDAAMGQALASMKRRENWLYWSVIALGLAGFIVILMNGNKLAKLKIADEERRITFILLQNRLAAMEASQDGIGIIDRHGHLTYANTALMRLHGITRPELSQYIGKPWTLLYNEKGRQVIEQNVMPLLLEEGIWHGESPIERKTGEIVYAELSLTMLEDGGFIGTARDITDRRRTQIEKKVLERQFYQAQKMEAIGRLAGGIAHDFNNILAAMNGYAEFLIEDLPSESEQKKFAENILQAGLQARNLVDQMLAFSRHENTQKESFNLRAALEESLSLLKATLPKTIKLENKSTAKDCYIQGSATQIAQVIMNLCVNARDAIGENHGSLIAGVHKPDHSRLEQTGLVVTELGEETTRMASLIKSMGPSYTRLTMGQLEQGVPYVSLVIEDTGTGMKREVMEHVFEPFFTTKPVDEGTGLGLSTVHGVVVAHKGAMIIDSKVGEGTRFEIFFPEAKAGEAQASAYQYSGAKGEDVRILLVEDQEDVRRMTERMLVRVGFEVASCEDGLEALEILTERPDNFDLVVTDQNMPRMTGVELVQALQKKCPDMPFIVLSGYSEVKLQDIMRDHDAVKAVLRKPVQKDKFIEEILNIVSVQSKAANKL